MKIQIIRKAITSLLVAMSILATVPMQAHAEWRSNSTGWWNTEGTNSYSVGWRNLGGSWYYFNSNGYMATGWIQDSGNWFYLYSNGTMAKNTTINGYTLGSNGAWTTNSNKYTSNHQTGTVTTAGDGSIARNNR